MKAFKYLFLGLILTIFFNHKSFGQNPPKVLIPATPTYEFFDTSCYIPCGTLKLPQGRVDAKPWGNPGTYRNIFIPNNRYTWALAIAHAWGYTRNALKMPSSRFSMDLWLAILNNESQLACIPKTTWDPGRGAPIGFQTAEDGPTPALYNHDGCYQMESSGSWNSSFSNEMRQAYPSRLVNSNPNFYFSNNFDRQTITMAYEFVKEMGWARYKFGVDLYALSVGASDPLAVNKVFCAFHNNGTWSFGTSLCGYVYSNRVSLQTNANWPDFGGLGHATYLSECGATMSVLQGLTSHGNYPGGTSQKLEDFDQNIPWDTLNNYLNNIKPFYQEYSAAAWSALVTKVQNKFISISGSITTPIKFSLLGPVIDQIIIGLPKEDPSVPSLTINSFPPTWDGTWTGWGDLVPTGRIGIVSNTACLGNSYQVSAIVTGGDDPANTYKWYENGTLISSSTTKNLVRTPTTAGSYTYRLEMCNSKGCLQAGCDKTVTVTNCNSCGMTAIATPTKTPCQNQKAGSISLAITGATNYTVNYSGPVSGSLTGSGSPFIIPNLPDGFYNIEVVKQGSPTCKAVASTTVQYITAQNASLKGQLVNISPACTANLQADITANPVPCLWTVNFYHPTYYSYFPAIYVTVKATNSPTGSYQTNILTAPWTYVGKAEFYASSGENIDIDMNLTPTPGADLIYPMYFEIVNSLGTVVWSGTTPAHSVSYQAGYPDAINYHVKTYGVTCPVQPSLNYTFSWNPSITVTSSTGIQSKGNVGVTTTDTKYVVTATSGGCSLTDTVLVAGNSSCIPACTPPAMTPSFVSTSVKVCSPATTASVTATLPTGVYYQLFNSSTNAAIGSSAGPTTSAGNVTINNVAAGSYHIRIASTAANLTTPTCYKASTTPVTVTVNPLPTVSISPASPKVCIGSTVTLTGTPTGGTWTSGTTSVSTINASGVASGVAAGTSVITYSYTDANTCTNTSTQTLTVNAQPTLSITPATPNVCVGSTVNLTGNPAGGTWSSGTTTVATINASGVASGVAAGTSVITYSYTDANSCSNTATQTLTVNAKPTLSITPATPKVCVGSTLNLTGNPAGGTWTSGTTSVSTINASGVASGVAAGTSVITYSFSDANSCSNTATQTLTVNAKPTVTVTPATPKVCEGSTFTLTGNPTGGTWTSGTTAVATINASGVASGVAAGTSTITYSYTDANTCTNTATQTLTVNAKPTVSITPASPSVCIGNTLNLTGTPAGGNWTSGTTTVATINASGIASGVSVGSSIITYSYTDANSCSNSATQTLSVTTAGAASVTVAASANPICTGTPVTFTATPTNGGAPTYQWKLNGNPVGTNSNTYSNSTLINSDKVTVVMTSSLSCVTGSPATSNQVTMTVNAKPTVTVSPTTPKVCEGSTVTLTGNPAGGTWTSGTTSVATINTSGVASGVVAGSSVITYSYTDANSCSNTATQTLTVNAKPAVSIMPASPGVCIGGTVNLTGTPSGGTWTSGTTSVATINGTGVASGVAAGSSVITYNYSDANSCSNTATQTLTVNNAGAASVTIAESANNICTGTPVTFTATPTNGGTASYQWKLNGGNVGTNSATYTNSTLNNSDKVSVVMTSSLACVTGSPATSNTVTMVITPPATPSVVISPSSNPICSGQNVTFTATPTSGGTPTYQWTLNGNPVGTSSATYSNNTLANGDLVKVVMTSNATCISTPTATSNTVTMTITGTVVPAVNITADNTTICSGDMVTMTANPSNEGTTPSYAWKLNGNPVGTNSPTYSNSSLTATDVVTVTLTSSLGCASTPTATSGPFSVSVNASTPASVTILPDNNNVCEGTAIVFNATPSNGGSTPVYQWNVNGSDVGTNSTSYSSSTLNNNDVVTVIMTSNKACVTGSPATSPGVTMVINSKQVPSVSVAPDVTSACAGQPVNFTASPINGGTPPSYQWKVNGSNAGTNNALFSSSTLKSTDVVTVEMTSTSTCVTTNTAVSSPVSVTINTSVTPTVNIDPSNPSSCIGAPINFTAQPTSGGTTPTYQWKVNGTNVGTGNAFSSTTLNNNDVVSVQLTSSDACASPATASAQVNVTIISNPLDNMAVAVSDTCSATDSKATISSSQTGITYEAYISGNKVGDGVGNGGSLSFTLNTNGLADGPYTVNFKAVGCGGVTIDLTNTADFVILGNPVDVVPPANALICDNTNSDLPYSVVPVTGATSYEWTINNGGSVTSNGTTASTVTSITTDVTVELTDANINPTFMDVYAVSAKGLKSCKSFREVIKQLPGYHDDTLSLTSYTICQKGDITFELGPKTAMYYDWNINNTEIINQDVTGKVTRTFDQPGVYTITIQPVHPCRATGIPPIVKTFTVVEMPIANAGSDTTMSAYHSVTLDGTGSSTGTYTWTSNDGGSVIQDTRALVTTADFKALDVTFTLTVEDPSGTCIATDTKEVILDLRVKDLPNTFTPNGDGNHDVYEIPNINYYPKSVVYIYNQWGEMVFKSNTGYTNPWDGRRNGAECEIGAYFMVIEFNQDGIPSIKETINLLR